MVMKLSIPYETKPPLLAAHRWRNHAAKADNRQANPTRRLQPARSKDAHAAKSNVFSFRPTLAARVTNHPSLGIMWLSKESNASARLRVVPESRSLQSNRSDSE